MVSFEDPKAATAAATAAALDPKVTATAAAELWKLTKSTGDLYCFSRAKWICAFLGLLLSPIIGLAFNI